MRAALKETLEATISLYLASTDELAIKPRVRKKRT